ncbi:MAG: serine hydrolase [Phycisphaerae bacterium]|nr:serine hydrolase [Phycisphaerae bacterium]
MLEHLRASFIALALLVLSASPATSLAQAPADHDASGPVTQIESHAKTQRAAAKARLDLIIAVLNGDLDRLDEVRFTESFITKTPRDQAIASIREVSIPGQGYDVLQTRRFDDLTIGAWIRSKANRDTYFTIRLGIEPIQPHRIDQLEIKSVPPPGSDLTAPWRELDEAIAKKSFRTGLAVMELRPDGSHDMIHMLNPDDRRGIGTMGALFVHLALAELIDEGGATWDKKLAIDETLRSLPDTRTSKLAGGVELSLSQYARRAMAEADNTCADHLLAHLGRERVELARDRIRAAAARDADLDPATRPGGEPFLSIMENYRLKCGVTTLITRYAEATNDERRLLLENEVPNAEIHLTLLQLWKKPQELLRVGWTASPRELCFVGATLIQLSSKPNSAWAIDALRPPQQAAAQLGTTFVASRVGGEPGADAGLWIAPRNDGRMIIMSLIFNDDAPLVADQTNAIKAKAIEILSIIP